ncbi:MAG: DUF4400 domain-containing protein [Woeseia sp.]|nr:DUF4400 domain-containing protein [Woeseia sp.]
MRRTSGARESGFIYHRAKRAVPAFLLMLWAVYLVPPVPLIRGGSFPHSCLFSPWRCVCQP